jgi:hypothetical protein
MTKNLRDLHGEAALRHVARALHEQHDVMRRDLLADPVLDILIAHVRMKLL